MSPTTLRCTVDGPVATITLARPDKMNAFNATMHAELREALEVFERDVHGGADRRAVQGGDDGLGIVGQLEHQRIVVAGKRGAEVETAVLVALEIDRQVLPRGEGPPLAGEHHHAYGFLAFAAVERLA